MNADAPRWSAIAAMAANRVIGRDGRLPWHLPGELQWFKRLTLGHPIIMGRATYQSIGARPLPGRRHLVLSAAGFDPGHPEVEVVADLAALDRRVAELGADVFVIGGAQVYRALLGRCSTLFLTRVKGDHDGDAFFPPFEHDFALAEVLVETPEFEIRRYERSS